MYGYVVCCGEKRTLASHPCATEEEAQKLAAEKNERAKALGIYPDYTVREATEAEVAAVRK